MQLVCNLLSDINKDIANLKPHLSNVYLKNIFEAAFIPENKFILPEGTPPYKPSPLPSAQVHGAMWSVCKKLNIFWRADLTPLRRESLFITSLESVSAEEVQVLLAIKEQKLHKLYSGITLKAIDKAFPNYIKRKA